METWTKRGQFPCELSRVVRVMSPQQGDYNTVRERLSFKMIMPGPLPHNAPLRTMRVGGGTRETVQHDNSDNQIEQEITTIRDPMTTVMEIVNARMQIGITPPEHGQRPPNPGIALACSPLLTPVMSPANGPEGPEPEG